MPICEADPWRLQYFQGVHCPFYVRIPTEDADAWEWFPQHRWIYDKLAIAHSQGLHAAPHGVMPPSFPVFSKPMMNLRGMGIESRIIQSIKDYRTHMTAGHFWMELLSGKHVSTDVAVQDGRAIWSRHATGVPGPGGTFDHWIIHAEAQPELEVACGTWIARHLAGYTGMVNLETIGGLIIEAHLRFADQWPDLYGPGWIESVVGLYADGRWRFTDASRRDGYSVALFAPRGRRYKHPPRELLAQLRAEPGICSLQITFYEDRAPEEHAMPPGGFRVAIVNCVDLQAGRDAREALRAAIVQPSLPADAGRG